MTDEKKIVSDALVLSDRNGEFTYNRNNSLATESLATKMSELYNVKYCQIVPSGLSAIHAALTHCVRKMSKPNLVYGDEMFAPTTSTVKHVSGVYGTLAQLYRVNVTDGKSVENLFVDKLSKKNNILFVESCSNPNGYMLDPTIIAKIRALSKSLLVIVDNTWTSTVSFNPFEHGAHIVVVSLTKYYGAGTAIAGAILTSDKIIFNDIQRFCRLIGCHTSPVHAKLILEQLPSLQERVKRASIITVQVVKTLDEQKVRVCHPSIEKHPSHAITKQFLRTWPAVFTFLVRGQKSTIQQVLAKSKFMEYKTSFGARKSRFDTFPKKHGTDILCRVAVGDLDSPDTIVQAVLDVIHRANIHTIPHQTKSLSNIE